MKLILETPVKLRLADMSEVELMKMQNLLSYKDRAIEEELRRFKKNTYNIKRLGQEAFQLRIDDLTAQINKSLLFEDEAGFYTLSGLQYRIQRDIDGVEFINNVVYPEPELIPWQRMPSFDPHPYQDGSVEGFLSNPHSHVEIATGLGKSHIAVLMVKAMGLPTIISTPSIGLAKAMYKDLKNLFGPRKVGMFGGSKKEIGKDILVCVGKSLSMVHGEDIKKFEKYQVFISDESHTLPAKQFNYFCTEVVGHCPYRWFLSATQERNDGRDLTLEGLIGKRVYEMSIQEGIAQGYLAKLDTLVFDVPSYNSYQNSTNVVKMNQKHFYGNPFILNIIGGIVGDAMAAGLPTLILIDEHEQEKLLRDKLGLIYAYARGGSDTAKICEEFNQGKHLLVVGTSAVSTGTNFKPVRLTINWQGGKAETKFKQGVIGRSTRTDKESGKTECKLVDFRVNNVPMLKRHGNQRVKLYKEVGPVKIVEYVP